MIFIDLQKKIDSYRRRTGRPSSIDDFLSDYCKNILVEEFERKSPFKTIKEREYFESYKDEHINLSLKGGLEEAINNLETDLPKFKVLFKEFKEKYRKIVGLEYKLHDILTANPSVLDKLRGINLSCKKDHEALMSILKRAFCYSNKFDKYIRKHFAKLDWPTCIYCNRSYLTVLRDKNGEINEKGFNLDHFYDKATYPYLALSFYNLVPSCQNCNSIFKNKKNELETTLSPYNEDFDFHESAVFSFVTRDEVSLILKNPKYRPYVSVFKLARVYRQHGSLIEELIQKRNAYPPTKIEEMSNLLPGLDTVELERIIFDPHQFTGCEDERPLAKLYHDILKELNISDEAFQGQDNGW